MDRPLSDLIATDDVMPRRRLLPLAVTIASEPFVVVALVHLTVLAWRLPLFDRLPGWFFTTHATPIAGWWFVLLAIVPASAIALAFRLRQRGLLSLACLVAGAFIFQHALAWSEGRGLEAMRDRIVRSGHAEFAEVAVAQPALVRVLTRYEAMVRAGELGRYPHSKPPGTLLAYMATERVSRLFAADRSPQARLAALRTTAAVTWPLLACLALVPLYAVARRIGDRETALIACSAYMLVPSTALMTLHTDQVLFPLFATTTIVLAIEAARRAGFASAVVAGVWLWVTGFFTFPLLLIGPIAVAFAWGCGARERLRNPGAARDITRRISILAAGMIVGLLLGLVVFRVFFDYDVIARYNDARQFNAVWKGWEGGAFQTLYFAWMNLLEFIVWLGIPLAFLAFGSMQRAIRVAAGGDRSTLTLPAIATLAVLAYVAFFGQAKGETARLWLFLVPILCVLAAGELRVRWKGALPAVVTTVLVLQWLTVVLTKTGQDFH